jgi:hypothetical protein
MTLETRQGRIGSKREVKENQRKLIKGMVGPWAPWDWAIPAPNSNPPYGACRVYRNNYYTVLEARRQTEWGRVTHLMIRRHDNKMTDSWREKQKIKNTIMGEGFTAIEVYPDVRDLVDEANMAHLWVLHEKELPFGLHERVNL